MGLNIEGGRGVGDCLKRGLGQFVDSKRGLAKKRGVVFLRGLDTLMHTVLLLPPSTPVP